MKKSFLTALAAMAVTMGAWAQQAITPQVLQQISSTEQTVADKAIRNAMASTPLNTLATTISSLGGIKDTEFTYRVKTKGITNQRSSGRCWLFTGMNVLRSRAINEYELPELELSQVYLFFYDQLEKSNLFLQCVIDSRDKAMDDQFVSWLFAHPIGDGGTFAGVADLVKKYGVVPKSAMPETQSSNNTAQINAQIKWQLRDFGMQLRDLAAAGNTTKQLEAKKVEMLATVYHILTLAYGIPPKDFTWTYKKTNGTVVSVKKYTPKQFYKELWNDDDLSANYVMLMNDPTHEYGKVYQIQYDRHTYDGHDWVYLNLPMPEIKEMVMASIKDNTAMYISCDVGKFCNRKDGLCDLNNFDYESLLGAKFTMDKKQRVLSHTSASSHAMTMIAVQLDPTTQKPTRWMVENSWGADTGFKGNLVMTDEWFDEYMFRFVVNKKYAPESVVKAMKQKPVLLPAWDPMFSAED